jgi:molybdopterin-biosynthesis enzyme MoeA-like protein
VRLVLHPEAEREIRGRFGAEITPARLRMGEFPEGSSIIPNPVNRIPGFSYGEHHFVPGFPQMARPMVEWVLDNRYRHLFDRDRWTEESILVFDAGESQLIAAMEAVGAAYAGVKVFSLPSMGEDGSRRHVELGVRGDPAQVKEAAEALRRAVRQAGFPFSAAEKTKPA